jgi:hypothetical protein
MMELMTCRLSEDPTSPVPAEGYMVSFTVFYERGFDVLSHRFLYSLLQYYSLELHNLTPLGILHIMTFVTLCEAFMGIDPPLQPVEPLLSCLVPAGLRRGSSSFGWREHLR